MEFLIAVLEFFGTNSMILGVCSLCGIIGFIITILTFFRTSKISKILRYNSITLQYNKDRLGFQKTFEGHRKSIDEDGIKSDVILKDILKNIEEYQAKFEEIFSYKEKFSIWCFKRILKRTAKDVDFNKVSNHLAELAGRLSKKEEIRNG